jgi:addiction module RelE/StbE family toxin
MKVRWSNNATNELEDIFAFIRERSSRSARAVARRIIDRAESLAQFPLKGENDKSTGMRKLAVVNYPYVVFYRVNNAENEVQIVSVQHTARKQSPAEG